MVEKHEEDFILLASRNGVLFWKIYLGMSRKANRLLPIGQTLLSYGQRHDSAITAKQMHTSAPIKNQPPSDWLARSAVLNLRAYEAKKPHAGIAKDLFELFQHLLDRMNKIDRIFEEKTES